MSIETAFQALLAGHTPLTALVGDAIAQDAVPEGEEGPLVVYGVQHDFQRGLDNSLHGDVGTVTAVAWAADPELAGQLADAMEGAVATVPDKALVNGRLTTFEPDLGLHGVQLLIAWID